MGKKMTSTNTLNLFLAEIKRKKSCGGWQQLATKYVFARDEQEAFVIVANFPGYPWEPSREGEFDIDLTPIRTGK